MKSTNAGGGGPILATQQSQLGPVWEVAPITGFSNSHTCLHVGPQPAGWMGNSMSLGTSGAFSSSVPKWQWAFGKHMSPLGSTFCSPGCLSRADFLCALVHFTHQMPSLNLRILTCHCHLVLLLLTIPKHSLHQIASPICPSHPSDIPSNIPSRPAPDTPSLALQPLGDDTELLSA